MNIETKKACRQALIYPLHIFLDFDKTSRKKSPYIYGLNFAPKLCKNVAGEWGHCIGVVD